MLPIVSNAPIAKLNYSLNIFFDSKIEREGPMRDYN